MSCQEEQGKVELLSETKYNMDVNRGGEQCVVTLHSSTWPVKGTKTAWFRRKLLKQTIKCDNLTCMRKTNDWTKSLLAYGCNMKSVLLEYKEHVLCRKRADNSHKTDLAISLCRLHSRFKSLDREDHSQLQHQHCYTMWVLHCMICVGEDHFDIKSD